MLHLPHITVNNRHVSVKEGGEKGFEGWGNQVNIYSKKINRQSSLGISKGDKLQRTKCVKHADS